MIYKSLVNPTKFQCLNTGDQVVKLIDNYLSGKILDETEDIFLWDISVLSDKSGNHQAEVFVKREKNQKPGGNRWGKSGWEKYDLDKVISDIIV